MKRVLFLLAVLAIPTLAHAQLYSLTKEQMVEWTAQNPFERFPDGRPKVPDALIERAKQLSSEEVLAVLPGRMYRRYKPMMTAMGMVAPMVNVPHRLPLSALTTTSPTTERMIIIINKKVMRATNQPTLPISSHATWPGCLPLGRLVQQISAKPPAAPARSTGPRGCRPPTA